MKNKKLLGLLTGLICITVCTALLLSACVGTKDDPTEAVTDPITEPVTGEQIPVPTDPEPTEVTPTEPEETEPEQTEPEATEPEETEPSGGSSKPSVNTGTGGGYNPGTSDPTEPEAPTEPEIQVPAAGAEGNAYYEQLSKATASFQTVTIAAGETVHYRVKTSGTFLRVEDEEIAVVYDGNTYTPEDGVLELTLPADDSKALSLQFTNNGSESKTFGVNIMDALGSQDNPIVLESIALIETALEEGDSDGIHYVWTADADGVLYFGIGKAECADDVADVIVTVNGESMSVAEAGAAEIPVSAGDTVAIQVLVHENADGIYPAAQIISGGYIAPVVELNITEPTAEVESIGVPSFETVIYRITGIRGKMVKIMAPDFLVRYEDEIYGPNEEGLIELQIPAGTSSEPVEIELLNAGAEEKTVVMQIGYSIGHKENPQILTELDEIPTQTYKDLGGYYYSYTAPSAGMVTFQIWEYPTEGNKADIQLLNKNTGESANLWTTDENGESVENYNASVTVKAGDEVIIHVTVVNILNRNVDDSLVIFGSHYGTQELPIPVQYPGFTADVPAGTTVYYEGYNMNEMIFSASGENLVVSHAGQTYDSAEIIFNITVQGRNPAVFGITNTGTKDASYNVTFTYPKGHAENPAALVLGTNTVTQTAGHSDYCYIFTAPRAGSLTVTFDAAAQWVYTVDNLTKEIYGDTQWSDSDPLITETTVAVAAGDKIRVKVNTYDAANMFESPAGTVSFTAKYVSGPTAISTLTLPVNTTVLPGEYSVFTGLFYDHVLTISNAKDLVVIFNGTEYTANEKGEISVEFPAASGTQTTLEYTVYNAGTAQIIRTMSFSSKEMGSKENPDVLPFGKVTLTQPKDNSEDYYYTYTATARGNLIVTFDANADWVYQITNLTTGQTSGTVVSVMGPNTFRITVRPGQVVELMVNTFDPRTGGSPEGTVEFTVSFQ